MSAAEWIAKRHELLAVATEGPWEADGTEVSQHWSRPEPWKSVASNEVACMAYCYGGSGRGIEREDDARFIADARTSLPLALDALQVVLEHHRSVPGPSSVGDCCRQCSGDEYEPYPCDVVRDIEAILNKEKL